MFGPIRYEKCLAVETGDLDRGCGVGNNAGRRVTKSLQKQPNHFLISITKVTRYVILFTLFLFI